MESKFDRTRIANENILKSVRAPLTKSITEFPIIKFNHLWCIKNFSLIPIENELICSPDFSPPISKDKWFIKLRPKTFDKQTEAEYIGIHLFLKSCEDTSKSQQRAKYIISVLDVDGNRKFTVECSRQEGRIFKAGIEGHGFKLIAPRDILLDPNRNMLGHDDTLQILCEITVFGEMDNKFVPVRDFNLYNDCELASRSITSDFASLIKSTLDCDIIVVSKDGSEFDAHRLVLKARSPVFKAMFEEEKAESRIEIPDFEAVVINDMLYFIYTDNIVEARINKIADQLLLAAEKYKLQRLKMLCEQYLASKISFERCDYLLSLSNLCNCKRLREKVLEFKETIS
ncbi:hypothetical protein B4U79_13075 [Dinothrombium tinctorium]|uniref:Uncharacterized protein n=1 Tax=Dinothrombium tinctorium TaxID=1965070 RepID=A0A443QBK8_9ACAR|nr:hypothetical protein B4U79_13075 [Dinothrombium tinctorium]